MDLTKDLCLEWEVLGVLLLQSSEHVNVMCSAGTEFSESESPWECTGHVPLHEVSVSANGGAPL